MDWHRERTQKWTFLLPPQKGLVAGIGEHSQKMYGDKDNCLSWAGIGRAVARTVCKEE